MKLKYLTFAVMAGAALVGCTKTEVNPVTGDTEVAIKFASPVNTKAQEIAGTVFSTTANFDVWGVKHSADYASETTSESYIGNNGGTGVECTYQGDTKNYWSPSVDYYWPKTGKLSFVALSPAGVTGAKFTAKTGIKIPEFSADATPADQVDLMFSDLSSNWTGEMFLKNDDKDNDTKYKYKGVDLLFHHALASIHFTFAIANSNDGEIRITVNSVKLKNVYNKGAFESSDANPSVGSWTMDPAATKTEFNVLTVPYTCTTTKEKGGSETLLLIPQGLTASVGTVLEINYTRKDLINGTPDFTETVEMDLWDCKDDDDNVIDSWKMGHRYTYNVMFKLNKIYFDPASDEWVDVAIALPKEVTLP